MFISLSCVGPATVTWAPVSGIHLIFTLFSSTVLLTSTKNSGKFVSFEFIIRSIVPIITEDMCLSNGFERHTLSK